MLKSTPRRKYPLNSRGRRRGVTILFCSFALVVLLGMTSLAVDYGIAASDANAMQRSCDAAALAGATQLALSGTDTTSIAYDTGNARAFAKVVAGRNGVTVPDGSVTFPSYNKIRVESSRTRQYLFAKFLGFRSGEVTRHTLCAKVALQGITNAVPLAMTIDDYNTYKSGGSVEYKLINNHDTDFAPGTVASLDLRPDNSGKSGSIFQNDLTYGYNGTVYIGEKIDNFLNANISAQGPDLDQAMQQRFTDASNASYADTGSNYTYPNYPPDDRRIMFLIVADPNPYANNNPTLNARFFVPVYVESTRSPAGKTEYVRFRIIPGYTFNSENPNIILGDDSTPMTGITAIVMKE